MSELIKKQFIYYEDENLDINVYNKYIKAILKKIQKIHIELISKEQNIRVKDIRLQVFMKIYEELNEIEKELGDRK